MCEDKKTYHDDLCSDVGRRVLPSCICQHHGLFDVIAGSCGHTWLSSQGKAPGVCPTCFDVDCKVRAQLAQVEADARKRTAQEVRDMADDYGSFVGPAIIEVASRLLKEKS